MRLLTLATTSLRLAQLLRCLVLAADSLAAEEVRRTAKTIFQLLVCCLPKQRTALAQSRLFSTYIVTGWICLKQERATRSSSSQHTNTLAQETAKKAKSTVPSVLKPGCQSSLEYNSQYTAENLHFIC
jgi:hypothetical protein